MDSAVSQSTFFLTMLLGVGLFFFIKASTKDRTELAEFSTDQSPNQLHQQLLVYFQSRAYRVLQSSSTDVANDDDWVKLVGLVRPSVFLAVFLSFLAAVALLCLGLVLATLFSGYGAIFFAAVLLSPTAAIVYWKRAEREEQVAFRIHPDDKGGSSLSVCGHRDEILQLKAEESFKALKVND